jgi:class 3 adenylate cyclase
MRVGDYRKKVNALFADVGRFATFSEQLSPEETMAMLNDYSEQMIEPVFNNFGHPKKLMGDGLMAFLDAINLAPHVEQATRNRRVDILVSENSHLAARSRFPLEPVGEVSINGNAENAGTYTTKPVP